MCFNRVTIDILICSILTQCRGFSNDSSWDYYKVLSQLCVTTLLRRALSAPQIRLLNGSYM